MGWLVLVVAPILSVGGCGGGESSEASAERTGPIAFTVNRSGFGEIWVMDSDGRDRVRLTARGRRETDASGGTSPAWSPDGMLLAYASSGDAVAEDQRDVEIYVMRADGSGKRRLTNDHVHDATPAWSPEGKRIAFAHTPGVGTEEASGVIVVMDAEGQRRAEITRHREARDLVLDSQPAWSPDGSQIAFTRATYTPDGRVRIAVHVRCSHGRRGALARRRRR